MKFSASVTKRVSARSPWIASEVTTSAVLLMTVILAPAALLYIKARSEHARRLFTPTEIALFALIVAGGVIGAIGLWTGRITL
jgi:hypothetical protein